MTSALITGGAGFIGTNLAQHLLGQGERVIVLDDLSRPGVERNLAWLRATHGGRLSVELGDVRDADLVRRSLGGVRRVFHLAAQVAVTSSLSDPLHDFDVNLRGTLNLLEQLRRLPDPPALLFTSTNKVYGDLADLSIRKRADRYEPRDEVVAATGINERRGLHFCSPYGCSKGSADQYVSDYAASFGLATVVFRMSCIYGPHQCGTEDQGWVAHFVLQALSGRAITIYGDGCQVRDLLFVDDLVDAMLLAVADPERMTGQAYNMGGGPANAVSLLQVVGLIERLQGGRPVVDFADWRVGDQQYYASDTRAFSAATGWAPTVSPLSGVTQLHRWLRRQGLTTSVVEAV